MAEVKTIDQLPNKLSLAGSDVLPVDDGVQSYKVPFSTLLSAVPGLISVALSQDGTSIVATYRDGTSTTLRTSDPAKQDALTFDQTPTDGSDNPVTSDGIATALAAKQDTLTFDNTPTENSNNPVKSGGVYSALSGKQDTLTFDSTPTDGSQNPVTSGGIATALAAKQDTLTIDQTPTAGSTNPVASGGVSTGLAAKQDTLTFDNTPTENSDNPVKSGGVYSALSGKQDVLTFDSTPTVNSDNPVKSGGVYSALSFKQDTLTFDSTPTDGSDNPVKSDGIKSALDAKQDTLTFDNAPTENSNNPVKSGGVFTALDGLSAQIGVIVKIMASAHTDDWNVIKQVVEQGYGSIAYPVGSQFAVNHANYGSLLFDVVHHITPESDALHKEMLPSGKDYGMVLMLHHVIYSTQFDQTEAFYYAENGLTAGTYNIKIVRQPWFAGDVGKYFQFTLASDVPAGSVLCWDGYDKTREGRNVTVYESLSATTAQQTAAMTEGQGGTSLGDIDGTGNTNHFDRSVLGSNDWEESGVRQWLNAETQSGWWEPKTNYDRIVSYSSRSGFFYGLPSDFKNAIVVSNHKNRSNTVFDSHGTNQAYSTQDKIWLPSGEEVGLGSEQSIVCGKVFDYYKNAANADRIKYDITSQTTARGWWLRVPVPNYSYDERIVHTSGALSSHNASSALGIAPACIL